MTNPEENREQGTTAFEAAKNVAKRINELGGEDLKIATELVVDRSKNATENDPNSPDYRRVIDGEVAAEMGDSDAMKLENSYLYTRSRDIFHMLLGEHPLEPRAYEMMREVKYDPATIEEIVNAAINAELINKGYALTEEKRKKMVEQVTERLKSEY